MDAKTPRETAVTKEMAGLIKGMLKRGDINQYIVAFFGGELNPARIAEIKAGTLHPDVPAVLPADLPPPGPYPTHAQLWKMRATLEVVNHHVIEAIAHLRKMEHR